MKSGYKFVKGKLLLTMNSEGDVIREGLVVIKDNLIHDYGRYQNMREKYFDKIIENGEACNYFEHDHGIVMPGIVTAHTHHFQSLMKGIGANLNLDDWVLKVIFPLGVQMGYEETRIAGIHNMLEMIRTGTTCFCDSHYMIHKKENMDGLAKAVDETGIRGILCRATQDMKYAPEVPDCVIEDLTTALIETEACIKKHHNSLNGRLKIGVEAITPIDCTGQMIKELHGLAKKYETIFQMHTAETFGELQTIKADHNMGIIEYLDTLGVLDEITMLIHCVWINANEKKLIADRGVSVAHNPVANMILGDGVAPILDLKAHGAVVGIGVDGAASNNNQDMFESMKSCALLHRVHNMDASVLDAMDVIKMSTIDSARAIGLDKEVGSIEIGKKADIIIVDTKSLSTTPNLSAVSNMIFSGNGYQVDTVIIDGKLVLKDKAFVDIDLEDLLQSSKKTVQSMMKSANLDKCVSII
ncbi:amidohydrolase [Acidaminobacter sp. JC074]|uniref:amidohydrolase family protein n=1 Tax=Acidaminobacter sp. JC074 TaxID=2530199 RepID=UPI001F104D74|nr:amidohydrolase [Acidaminobacter sp. JC074]MCH4886397.1 amidohydrolase [Acidaminobacter sp. JC074]